MRLIALGLFLFSLLLTGFGLNESVYIIAGPHPAIRHSIVVVAIYMGPGLILGLGSLAVLIKPSVWMRLARLFCVALPVSVILMLCVSANKPLQYRDALAEWRQRRGPLTDHFPRSIPADAESIVVHCSNPDASDPVVIELSYKTSHANAIKLDQQCAAKYKHAENGTKGWPRKSQQNAWRTPPTVFYTSEHPYGADLPADFHVYTTGGMGSASGVAVSTTRNQVVYWAATWCIS